MKKYLSIIIFILILFPVLAFSQQTDINENSSFLESDGSLVGESVATNPLTYDGNDIPVILSRSVWENSDSLKNLLTWIPGEISDGAKNPPPDYNEVERIIIHDTGCSLTSPYCNNDSVNQISLIQNIYRFHSKTLGWGDIGYNYIIDRQGHIYEGRYGGNGVRGAHAYNDKTCDNFNIGSIGIVLLGNYSKSEPPEVMRKSLERLVAWLSQTNILNPQELNKTTKVWHNLKNGTSCDISVGGFTSSFTGAVVLGHNHVEAGNPDPGMLDFSLLRQNSANFLSGIKSYVYKSGKDPSIYSIKGGVVEEIAKIESEISSQSLKVATILKNQLDAYPFQSKTIYPDGSLLKSYTRDNVYFVEGGKRRYVASPQLFNYRKLSWSGIKEISDRELLTYGLSSPLTYPDGTLIKGDGEEVFLVKGEEKRHITSAVLFEKNGYKWNSIVKISDEELSYHSDGTKILFADGTLIKGTGPTVYLIDGQNKRAIITLQMFNLWDFKWENVISLSDKEIVYYSEGVSLLYPDNTLVKEFGKSEIYLVKNEERHWVKTLEAFLGLGYKWADVIGLSLKDISQYALGSAISAAGDLLNLEKGGTQKSTIQDSEEIDIVEEQVPITEQLASSQSQNIRIAIYSPTVGVEIKITSNGQYDIYNKDQLVETKEAGQVSIFKFQVSSAYRFVPKDENTIFEILSYEDRPAWNPNLNDNKFRGIIEVKYSPVSEKLWVINELDLEDYLKGVAEAINDDPLEYLKAVAAASRSYATFHLQNGGKYPGEIFHLKNSSSDQLYKGYGFESRAPNISKAVDATNGIVATYNNKVIRAVYSSGASTGTKSACSIWGGEFCAASYDYLKGGVKDPVGTVYKYPSCGGVNHCVGMSADGARKMAELGKTYEEILKRYYFGVKIESFIPD